MRSLPDEMFGRSRSGAVPFSLLLDELRSSTGDGTDHFDSAVIHFHAAQTLRCLTVVSDIQVVDAPHEDAMAHLAIPFVLFDAVVTALPDDGTGFPEREGLSGQVVIAGPSHWKNASSTSFGMFATGSTIFKIKYA